jgi:hypothetical protein
MVSILYFVAGAIAYVIVAVAIIAVVLVVALGAKALGTAGTIVAILIGTVFVLALFAAFILAYLAWLVSSVTTVVERAGPIEAFSRGIARVFDRPNLGRSLLIGLALFAVLFGLAIVGLAGDGLILGLTQSRVISAAYHIIVGILGGVFLYTFATVFYYDLRVRHEGLDLQLAAQAAATPSIAPIS